MIAVRFGPEHQRVAIAQVDSLWLRKNYAGIGSMLGMAAGSCGHPRFQQITRKLKKARFEIIA